MSRPLVLALTLLLALSLAPALPAAADHDDAPVYVHAGGGQYAYADWLDIDMRKRKGFWYLVMVRRAADAGGPANEALIARGRCRFRGGKRVRSIICSVGGRFRPIAVEDFSIHPTLEEATLRTTFGKRTHRVRWTGEGDGPEPYGGAWAGSGWGFEADGGGGMSRWASIGGRVFNKKIRTRGWWRESFLAQGAGGLLWAPDAPSGGVRLERTFRIRG